MKPPSWMEWPDDELQKPSETLLKESRAEMYNASSLFHTHVRSVLYVILSIPTIFVVFLRFWNDSSPNPLFYLLAGIFLVTMFIIGILAIFIIRRYYMVYTSALIFSARLHIAAGMWQIHPWFYRVIKQAKDWNKIKNARQFINKRTINMTNSFCMYALIIVVISLASLVCGLLLLVNY